MALTLTLRKRVLVATGMMIFIIFMLVSLPLIANAMKVQEERVRSEADLAAVTFSVAMESALAKAPPGAGDTERAAALGARAETLAERLESVSAWAILDGRGVPVAWPARQPRPQSAALDESALHALGFNFQQTVADGPDGPWTLHLRLAPSALDLFRGVGAFLGAFLVGTLVLLGVLYLLLDRLMLRPLDHLLAASRMMAARGVAAPVAGAERTDEVGELVRGFNAMSQEVFEHRRNLEEKVRQATAEYERAQKRLVLADRLSATGRLAAGIAHEINNPLGGMINAARALETSVEAPGRQAEYLRLIRDGLARIQQTVRGMLVFARGAPAVESVRLEQVIDAALQFSRHRIEREGVELVREIPADLPPVTGDSNQLSQVFLNLVVNALDAMAGCPPDRRRLVVEAEHDETGLTCRIRDTGEGMDEATRRQAFELFFTTKDAEKGTGLGLPICHNIISAHGGGIEIESTPGEGTLVVVTLPSETDSRVLEG